MDISNKSKTAKKFVFFIIMTLALTFGIILLLIKVSLNEGFSKTVPNDHEVLAFNTMSFDNYIHVTLSNLDVYKVTFYHEDVENSIFISSNKTMAENESLAFVMDSTEFVYKIPGYISHLGFERIEIAPVSGDGDYKVTGLKSLKNPDFAKYEKAEIIDFEVKVVEVIFKEDNYKQIKEKRLDAIKKSILLTSEDDYVPGRVIVDGEKFKTDIRLKGDWTDHLTSDKWSYRIKVSNDAILGMTKISLHKPEARGHAGEAVLHDFYRSVGGIAPRYDFVDLVVNGVYKGVYAMEESFDKRMVESANRREGVIIKEDETILWHNRIYYNKLNEVFPYKMPTTVFGESKVSKDDKLYNYGLYATHLYNGFESGQLAMEEVFDLHSLAKYLSILDIFSTKHGFYEQNRRFYFNPISFKLEPITFDNDLLAVSTDELFHVPDKEPFRRMYYNELFSNSTKIVAFLESYSEEIDRYNYICDRDNSASFPEKMITDKVAYIETLKAEIINPAYSSFYVAGHVYGAHENEDYLDHIYPKFEEAIEQFKYDQTLKFGILNGDTVKTASEVSYRNLLDTFAETQKPIHIVLGNHDVNDGGLAFDKVVGQDKYYTFIESNNLFILLMPDKYTWDINEEQLFMIDEAIKSSPLVDNIFVVSHELFWKWKDDVLTEFVPNSYFQKTQASNFYNDVMPLFSDVKQNIYFIAGDTGAFAGRPSYSYYEDGNIHFIASGMGAGQYQESEPGVDNYLYIKMFDDGHVDIKSVVLE